MKLSETMLKEDIMKKYGVSFLFLSVALFILCAAPPVFCASDNTEIMSYDPNSLDSDNDNEMVLEATSDELLTIDVMRKKTGTLYIVNSSSYCAEIYLDGKKYTDLQAGKQFTITKVPYGTHKFEGKECSNGSLRWGPTNYRQGATYTITLKNPGS
jgi:hypothetical protein